MQCNAKRNGAIQHIATTDANGAATREVGHSYARPIWQRVPPNQPIIIWPALLTELKHVDDGVVESYAVVISEIAQSTKFDNAIRRRLTDHKWRLSLRVPSATINVDVNAIIEL